MPTPHTPTPWKVLNEHDGIENLIVDQKERENICRVNGTQDLPLDQANAAFIVRAVNAHAVLLAIVKEIYADENDVTRRKHSDELRFRMEDAIAKAESL